MDVLIESLREEWQTLLRLVPRIVAALIVCVLFVAAGRLLGRGLVRVLQQGRLSPTHEMFFRNILAWAFGLFGVVVGLNLLGLQTVAAGLIAGGGISAVVLGFAFRGIGENLLAGLFLAFSRSFELGDLVKSGEFQGTVRGIALRQTHVRTADGRDVFALTPGTDLAEVQTHVMAACAQALRENEFILSTDVSSNLAIEVRESVQVNVA